MLIRYIRDNRTPVGVVVEVDGKIGWAQCNPQDKWDRERGLEIAKRRAELSDKRVRLMNMAPFHRELRVYVPAKDKPGEGQWIMTTFEKELARNIEIIQRRLDKKNVDN